MKTKLNILSDIKELYVKMKRWEDLEKQMGRLDRAKTFSDVKNEIDRVLRKYRL